MRCVVVIAALLLLVACGAPSTADIQATVQAGMQATAQAAPTATVPPAVTVGAYKDAVMEQIRMIGDGLKQITALIGKPDQDNSAWRAKVDVQLMAIQTAHRNLTRITVPPVMQGIHTAILDATGDCDSAMKLIPAGLDRDMDALSRATDLVGSCGEKMAVSAAKLQAFEVSQ